MSLAFVVAWRQFYGDAVVEERIIYLSSSDIAAVESDVLLEQNILPYVRHHAAFKFYANRLGLEKNIKAGRYLLRSGQNVVEIVRMLKLGVQLPVRVTFNNIRQVEQLAGTIAQYIESDSLSILKVLSSEDVAKRSGVELEEVISLFIPNTYEIWWTTAPDELMKRMVRESDRFWNDSREQLRKSLNLSRAEVITLASLVYEECRYEDEMERVAGVYINRLRKGMKLQSDPTVKYALCDFTLDRILYAHLNYKSPYNTYLYSGLPPGPIAIPSIAAIDAVLKYERHKYIYFCAREQLDGYHNFTSSYAAHLENARRYSSELNRRGIR